MEASQFLQTVETMHRDARARRLFFQSSDDEQVEGRTLSLDGRELLSFASCSYLALERHPRLIAGAVDHLRRFGTQFSASRGYVQIEPMRALERELDRLFGGHTLVATSTTLAHQVALPVLVNEKDALVMDHQVHHSVQIAGTLTRAAGAHVEVVRHGEIERAIERVARLATKYRTVWFACDGVYSMFGDLAPRRLLEQLLNAAPNVKLYVDDAHGMSWAGVHGRGSFLSRVPQTERIVVATSLNKAFSASGGCVVFPTESMRDRVRMCAAPLVFSGPLQPPMIGAALASAEIHLSPEIITRQRALAALVAHCNKQARRLQLPLLAENESPIFFFRCGLPRVAFALGERMLARGVFVTISAYPSVPMQMAGIRVSITTGHTAADIDRVLEGLRDAYPGALASEGYTWEQMDRAFENALPRESIRSDALAEGRAGTERLAALSYGGAAPLISGRHRARAPSSSLRLVTAQTIRALDRDEWDRVMGTGAHCSYEALVAAERAFSGNERPEDNSAFLYMLVRDSAQKLIAATFFTITLCKDDMLMRAEVSRAIENRRIDEPYLLTSRAILMGSFLSEGSHLFLEPDGPWRAALTMIIDAAFEVYERSKAGALILREFPAGDEEMERIMLERGLIKVPMLDEFLVDVTWRDAAGFLARLNRRRRRRMRTVMEGASDYVIRVHGGANTLSASEREHLYRLYRNVADRKTRINVFPLPQLVIDVFVESPAWELITLHIAPEAGGPASGAAVAWVAAYKHGGQYMPLVCGLDYKYVESHSAYRQLLYQICARAAADGSIKTIHLGMDAEREKDRFRPRRVELCAYLHARDDFDGARMREIAETVSLES